MTKRRPPTPLLKPRAYAIPSHAYGTTNPVRWDIPAGGDAFSRNLATLQHELVVGVETLPDPRAGQSRRPRKDPTDRGAAGRIARRWLFSRSYWQSCKTGHSWFNLTALAGAVELLMRQGGLPSRPSRPVPRPRA